MLKDRYYYVDAYTQTFLSTVVKEDQDPDGTWYVVLENTAFYPTGGGQPHDTGTLNGIPVLNVEEIDGEIRHTVAEKLNAAEVQGVIDWERRFDHMQQHSGQHILTAAFVELFDMQTLSFHLGSELCTIDLDVERVTPEQLAAAEKRANEMVLNNVPIETKWVTEAEVGEYPIRKELKFTDEIRLVIIPEFDYNGCGGTHPRSTGEVGGIKILATEKQKKKTRVSFVCGGRVLKQLHKKNEILSEASKQLSAPEEGVNEAIQKLLETNRALEKMLEEKREELLTYEVANLLKRSEDGIVKAAYKGESVQALQKLARLIVAEDENVIALVASDNDDKLQFVAARGEAVSASMKDVASSALPAINGRGGGKDNFVQGGGERTMSAEELVELMVRSVREA